MGIDSDGITSSLSTDQLRFNDATVLADLAGVVGDWNGINGTDNTVQFQALIDSVSLSGGGVILCGHGKIYNTGRLIPKSNVLIDLNKSTLHLKNEAMFPIFFDGGAGNGVRFGVINGILDCNQDNNNGRNVLGGVWLTRWSGLIFSDLTIKNCYREGLNLSGVRNVVIRNYKFKNSGINGAHFAYALDITASGAKRSQFISIDGMECQDVIGFGIHFFRCDDFSAKNLSFNTLNFGKSSIAITFTEVNRGVVTNIKCTSVSGDNIEINDSTDVEVKNATIVNAGNRPLLVGHNTPGLYNNRIKVSRISSTGTRGAVSCVLAFCIDSSFELMNMDKGVDINKADVKSVGNLVRNSIFKSNSNSATGILLYGKFTIENVQFSNLMYRFLDRQKFSILLITSILRGSTYILDIVKLLPSTFILKGAASGKLLTVCKDSEGALRGSLQVCLFLIDSAGNIDFLSEHDPVEDAENRTLRISGVAANRRISIANGSSIDLNVTIDVEIFDIANRQRPP